MTQISKNKPFKCGFVSIVGRPNVGKSTLVNSILRNNISIVTRKPQTTRNRILGIYTMPEYQAIFIDTPGIHINEKKAINRVMNKTAINAIMDTNLNLFVCDSSYWSEEDEVVLNQLKNEGSTTTSASILYDILIGILVISIFTFFTQFFLKIDKYFRKND